MYATFQTDRSPVQLLARDHRVLFTVPRASGRSCRNPGVSAEPSSEGTPHPTNRSPTFRMQVEHRAKVRYVEDAGWTGGVLRIAMFAWPGRQRPRVCARLPSSGSSLEECSLDDAGAPCSLVDWRSAAIAPCLPSLSRPRTDPPSMTTCRLQVSSTIPTSRRPAGPTPRLSGWKRA